MTIDERLEALTQSVELLSRMHQDNEKRATEAAQANEKAVQANEKAVQANEKRFAMLMDTMNRVGRILEHHDITIDEDRLGKLEHPEQ
jgi:protein involved in temperature-dependent protein secretion